MSDTGIKLNFINRSADVNNSSIVVFQQNVAEDFGEIAVAWQVIKNCGRGDNHPFNFPSKLSVSARDAYGNYTAQLPAVSGDVFEMVKDNSGDILNKTNLKAANPNEIEIMNNLAQGSISANYFRDGKLLAMKSNLAPGQKAVFEFQPRIYIGVVSQIDEGDIMDSTIIDTINTEISLFGMTSADIVMTGGGVGPNATAFEFQMENIK